MMGSALGSGSEFGRGLNVLYHIAVYGPLRINDKPKLMIEHGQSHDRAVFRVMFRDRIGLTVRLRALVLLRTAAFYLGSHNWRRVQVRGQGQR